MDSSKATTLASPKMNKNKPIQIPCMIPTAAYGCEHIQSLFKEHRKFSVQQYSLLLQTIYEKNKVLTQTCKTSDDLDAGLTTCCTSTFLCLQCPSIQSPELRDQHWKTIGHAFSVESRSGCLYCQNCEDFVYDPVLEEVRMQRGHRRRKVDEFGQNSDDVRLIMQNSLFSPCRALGLRGLYNMGQTCFMSVVIQCLIHNPFIKMFFLSKGHKTAECTRKYCTSCALSEIFSEFYSNEKTEGYGAVCMLQSSWMGTQSLAGYQQQDAHEYLQFILNSLHNENCSSSPFKNKTCGCFVHRCFSGTLQSTVTCGKCKNITRTFDPLLDFSLDIKQPSKKRKNDSSTILSASVDLKDCLERFTAKEGLASGEYHCQNCNDTSHHATKQLSIYKFPPIVTIHIKRFEQGKSGLVKVDTKIGFPFELDLYPYSSRANAECKLSSESSAKHFSTVFTYELSSIIVHSGKIDSGHYVAYSRFGNDWFLFDDVKVTMASKADVLDSNAYMLFYVVKNLDACQKDTSSGSLKNNEITGDS